MRSHQKDRTLLLSFLSLTTLILVLHPSLAYADFEGSLRNLRYELSGVVLPLLSVIGLLVASFSYLTGHPESKRHITYALIGAAVGFGAQGIIDFISRTFQ